MTIGNIMENLMQDKDGYIVTQSFNINSVLGRAFLQWAKYKWYHRHNVYDDIKESLDLTERQTFCHSCHHRKCHYTIKKIENGKSLGSGPFLQMFLN